MNLLTAWHWGTAELTAVGVEDARWQAELLIRGILNVTRTRFIAYPELQVADYDMERFRDAIRKRSLGMPLQYIVGHQEFYGREFLVTPAVLIPRPETELLVEEVLRRGIHSSQLTAEGSEAKGCSLRILDLCTGSGCIGLTLAAEIAAAMAVLTDISESALTVAEQNAARLGLTARTAFRQGDLYSPVAGEVFDIIVSNPPYIETAVIPTLSADVQNEPLYALDGGPDGLGFYRRIAEGIDDHLSQGGFVAVEIGHGQGAAVMQLFIRAGLAEVALTHDLAGKERVVTGVLNTVT